MFDNTLAPILVGVFAEAIEKEGLIKLKRNWNWDFETNECV